MARVGPIDINRLSPEQQAIHKEIAGPRDGAVSGPFTVWLQANPALADGMNRVGNTLRVTGKLDKRLFETTILCVARYWSSQYEWAVHAAAAVDRFGMDPAVIEAIRDRRTPSFGQADEQIVYAATKELCDTKALSEATYQGLVDLLGFELVVELITTIGFYTMVAVVLNGFEIPAPGGARPLS